MKVLFVMRSAVYVRNFESTCRRLAERGHEVVLVADWHGLAESNEIVERLCDEYDSIHHVLPPRARFTPWTFLGLELRRAVDYLRYLEPAYAGAAKLRHRAERGAPPFALAAAAHSLLRTVLARAAFARLLRWCDRAIPRAPEIDAFIREHDPDLVLVTPLVEPGSPQSAYLRSARAHGSRTGLCVYSWDNLTNKGLIQEPLDVVTVWNEAMKREAVALHGVPASRVVVTGAAAYDHWFDWQPRETRDAFCARVGLDPARPYLLYLCSSKFIAPDEVGFVRDWVRQLREASAALRAAGVLVRPHPQNAGQWAAADLSDLPGVAVWPRGGANPVDEASRAEYYDSIAHSAAVVGVNTSAQIESAIVGRGVYTVLADTFRDTQDGTLHFRHLREAGGGVLHVAGTFEAHAHQLEQALGTPPDPERRRRFLEAFVRPHGLAVAATPRLVEAIERTGALGRRVRGDVWWGPLLRPVLFRVAGRMAATRRARREKALRYARAGAQRAIDAAMRRARRQVHKRRLEAEREHRRGVARARREAHQRAQDELAAHALRCYQDVRERVREMCTRGGRPLEQTPAEREHLAAFEPLWEATPAMIAGLRRHGATPGNAPAATAEAPVVARLRVGRQHFLLRRQMPDDLYVPEPDALGSQAYLKNGDRFSEDSVRHFKAIAALQDAGVLGGLRRGGPRRVVWEIGGTDGGFAHHLTRLCPDVTYVMSAVPDAFLASAVYLQTVCPDARVRFVVPGEEAAAWRDWETVDLLFVPEGALSSFRFPRLDLVVDLASLRLMTEARVARHVRLAYENGARYFYSMLPTADAPQDGGRVWRAVEARYWPHPVPPRTLRTPPVTDLDGGPPLESDVEHLVGWRRLHA